MPDPRNWPTVVDKVPKKSLKLPGVVYHTPPPTTHKSKSSKEVHKYSERQKALMIPTKSSEETSEESSYKETDDQMSSQAATSVQQKPPHYTIAPKVQGNTQKKGKKKVTLQDVQSTIQTVTAASRRSQVQAVQDAGQHSAAQQPLAQLPLLPTSGAIPKSGPVRRRRKTKGSDLQQYLQIDTRAETTTSESDSAKKTHSASTAPAQLGPVVATSSSTREQSVSQQVSWIGRRRDQHAFVDQTASFDPLHVSFGQAQTHMYTQGGRVHYRIDHISTDESL